jgi:hypothetical protein
MPEKYIRVRDKDTGHQYDIFPSQFREEAHAKLDRFEPADRARKPKHNVKTPRAPKSEPDVS